MTRRGLAAGVAALLLLGTVASAGAAALTFFGLTFPEKVADAKIGPARDFETSDPGLGYGVKYEKPGWAIDVFIYDLGRKSIPDDIDSDVLKKMYVLRRILNPMGTMDAIDFLLDKLRNTKSNGEFFESMNT